MIADLDRVHAAWSRAGSSWRVEAVERLRVRAGYPGALIDRSLRELFGSMRGSGLRRWLHTAGLREAWLDGQDLRLLAFGPDCTVVSASGNVPGAAIPAAVSALLLKSPCLIKSAEGEPDLAPLYARSVEAEAAGLSAGLAAAEWRGGSPETEAVLLGAADAVIAYGSDPALESLRARLPLRARFLGFGHRISFSAVGRELLEPDLLEETADRAAADICMFDQQGCLSPQAVYVEEGGRIDSGGFCEALARALERWSAALPRRSPDASSSGAIHQYRTAVEMRSLAGAPVRLWVSARGTEWTVVLEDRPELEPCPLWRTAAVRPVRSLERLPQHLAPARKYLLSAALGTGAGRYCQLARLLGEVGVARVSPLGRAQLPTSPLFHDGVHTLAGLVRYTVVEA